MSLYLGGVLCIYELPDWLGSYNTYICEAANSEYNAQFPRYTKLHNRSVLLRARGIVYFCVSFRDFFANSFSIPPSVGYDYLKTVLI